MVAASKAAEWRPSNLVASPSLYSMFGAGRLSATRSISLEKSIPRTWPSGPTPLAVFLPIVAPHLARRLPDAGLGSLGAFARDNVEETRQVRRPVLQADPLTRGDAARAVPDHAARHSHETRLVEVRYGLDGMSVGVVPDEYVVVRRAGRGGVVGVEAPLQKVERVGDDLRLAGVVGEPRRCPQKDALE